MAWLRVPREQRMVAFESDAEIEARFERAIMLGLAVGRGLCILGEAGMIRIGWKRYRSRGLAVAGMAGDVAELIWLASRVRKNGGELDPRSVAADLAWHCVAQYVCAWNGADGRGSGEMNYATPSLIMAAATATASSKSGGGLLGAVAALAAYTSSSHKRVEKANRPSFVNDVGGIIGWAVSGYLFSWLIRRLAKETADAQAAVKESEGLLTAERARIERQMERARQQRLLHDGPLQTLEAVASGVEIPVGEIRAQARRDAEVLRRAMQTTGVPPAQTVAITLARQVDEFQELGLRIESLVDDEARDRVLPAGVEAAIREALNNVAKHSGASEAIAIARVEGSELTLVIRDEGRGFNIESDIDRGFGCRNSIIGAVADAGGVATIESLPGSGSTVTIRLNAD